MKRPPRRHHVIPAAYLAGFTPSGGRDDLLWVYDKERRHRWRARPEQAGTVKDFYRIQVDGVDEFGLEESLSRVESDLIPHLREFVRSRQVVPASLEPVLLFFAVQVVRGTGIRQLVEGVAQNHVLQGLDFVAADEESYAKMLAVLADHGHSPAEMPARDEFRELLRNGGVSAEFDRTAVHGEAFRHVEYFHGLLMSRHWSVAAPAEGAGYFVTSENPLPVAAHPDPEPNVVAKFSLCHRDCVLPLSRSLVLVGREDPAEIPSVLGEESVAFANAHVISHARYIFSGSEEFRFSRKDGLLGDQQHILAGSPSRSE